MESGRKHQVPSILMLPWLAHGHISPFLELAKFLTQRNFHIYFCSTSINLKPLIDSLPRKYQSSIQFVDLPLPSLPELPPNYHTTRHLPPHLMETLKTAFDMAKPDFANIVKSLKPSLVIYDILQPWAPLVAQEENIKAVVFLTFGASVCSFFYHVINNPTMEYPFPALRLPQVGNKKLIKLKDESANDVTNVKRFMISMEESSKIVLVKTSSLIEEKYIDHLGSNVGKEVVPVGPLFQDPGDCQGNDDAMILEWLDKKEPCSVVFVSFGSESYPSKQQKEEIAYGLELSEVGFIWAISFHGGEVETSLGDVLPTGFLERTRNKGIVIPGWAPQAKILRHPSIGGFVSHCGWGSIFEAINFGVPIITMPIQLDQPLNAKLVVNDIGVGVEVKNDGDGYERENVAMGIREVMVDGRGKEIRRKIKGLSERMWKKQEAETEVMMKRLEQILLL